jgi:membrane protein
MTRVLDVGKRTLTSFYDDQMTHHAAALTYYGLMSLFPAALLGLSLLGLLGQYPDTYNAIINYLEDVAPESVVEPLDRSLRSALQSTGAATTAFVVGIVVALYGTTGALEAARRALNVVFEVESGRGFVRRKLVDVVSTFILMALVLASLILVFVGGAFARDLLGFIGLGPTVVEIWNVARWPIALLVAMLVLVWLLASFGLSTYLTQVATVGEVYGAFASAIVLLLWLWLTNVSLLFGAELNAEIEREKELAEGVPAAETLNRPNLGR